MSSDNQVSATLTEADLTDILNAIATIRTKLPFLVSLTAQERREMPKMGSKSVGFDDKCTAYMASNPEFLPGFVAPAEVTRDRTLRTQMMRFSADLLTLAESVDDTQMVVSSEIWMADLAYYQSVREASRRGLPGAKSLHEDLSGRFPKTPHPATVSASAKPKAAVA